MRVPVILLCVLIVAASGAPLIVIHKSVAETDVLLGSTFEVTTTALNIGEDPAFDFTLRDGDNAKDVAVLESQGNVSITTTLSASDLGNLEIPIATASWAAAAGSEERFRATSNVVREEERDEKRHATELGPRGFVNVVTATEYERINSRFIKETILYILFAAIVISLPFGIYRQKQVQVDFHLKEARKK